MDEVQFLLLKKLVEMVESHEARIHQLERQVTNQVTDLSEDVEKLKQLAKNLPGVHFPDPNCDREDEVLNSAIDRQTFLQRARGPEPVPFPEDDYF